MTSTHEFIRKPCPDERTFDVDGKEYKTSCIATLRDCCDLHKELDEHISHSHLLILPISLDGLKGYIRMSMSWSGQTVYVNDTDFEIGEDFEIGKEVISD